MMFKTSSVAICCITAIMQALSLSATASASASAAGEVSFRGPFGIGVKPDGSFYVAEIQGRRISKFGAEGNYVGEIKTIKGYGELKGPFDVDVSPSGKLYIADTLGHCVLVLNADERLLLKLGSGQPTAAPGSFHEPHFVAGDEQRGRIYVADTHNDRIQIFDMKGKLLKILGGRTGKKEPGAYTWCNGVAVDAEGNVYAMNWTGAYINIYDSRWRLVGTFGKRGTGPGEFNDAYSIVCHAGTIWVADTYNNRLQQFSKDWKPLNLIGGKETSDVHGFSHPTDLDFDARGNIYVADWKNDRVIKLDPSGHFLKKWGSRAVDLDYTPPKVYRRDPCRGPVELGTYSAISRTSIDANARAGVKWIYYSCENQSGQWAISKEEVDYAHAKGLKAAASIAVFPLGAEDARWRGSPKYYMWKKGATGPDMKALSYFYPEVRRWKARHIAAQIARLGLDGIFLDYIRYPNALYGYEPAMVEAFKKETGRDAHAIAPDDWQWLKFRAGFITRFISELREELAQLDHPVEVSVFVNADWRENMKSTLQDWRTWTRMGIVDMLHLGIYTRDLPTIYEAVRTAKQTCPQRVKIDMMLCCWGGNLNTPELLMKGAQIALAAGPDQLTIYRGDSIDQLGLWDTIGDISRHLINAHPEGYGLKVLSGAADYQVFQRDSRDEASFRIQGWAFPYRDCIVERRIRRRSQTVRGFDWQDVQWTGQGNWEAQIKGLPMGGPYRIEFRLLDARGRELSRTAVTDILVGDLWFLGGQSNMDGCGALKDAEQPSEMVHAMTLADEWQVAEDPLNVPSEARCAVYRTSYVSPTERRPIEKRTRDQLPPPAYGAGLGIPFGKAIYRSAGVPVGLIVGSLGGSTMDQWSPALKDKGENSLYAAMIQRIGRCGGKIKGVLWWQGESDAHLSEQYEQKLRNFIASVRSDLGQPDLPFYCVQLGRSLTNRKDLVKGWNRVQEIQRRVMEQLPHAGLVASIDLPLMDAHLTTDGYKRVGMRLAKRVLRDVYGLSRLQPGPRLEKITCFQARHGDGLRRRLSVVRLGREPLLQCRGRRRHGVADVRSRFGYL